MLLALSGTDVYAFSAHADTALTRRLWLGSTCFANTNLYHQQPYEVAVPLYR